VFASAVVQGNSFAEAGNLFVAGLLGCSSNVFLAQARGAPYGVMVANRATATGNLGLIFDDAAILHFVTPDRTSFAGAATQVFVRP